MAETPANPTGPTPPGATTTTPPTTSAGGPTPPTTSAVPPLTEDEKADRARAAQKTRDPDTVETADQYDATDDRRRGDRGEARKAVQAARAKEYVGNPITPGAAGDPVEPKEVNATLVQDSGPVTLDGRVDLPSTSSREAPGPYDTVDPLEHASSVTPDKGTAAMAGFGTVNAVLPIPDPSGKARADVQRLITEQEADDRIETYQVADPSGRMVNVEHNITTGATKVLGYA